MASSAVEGLPQLLAQGLGSAIYPGMDLDSRERSRMLTNQQLEQDASKHAARYSKAELIGHGAQKKVYKAFDEEEGIEVAWNEVPVGEFACRTAKDRDKLLAEIRVLKQLRHKNIMTLKHWWFDSSSRCICFITELFTDGTLRQYRRKHKSVDIQVLKRWAWQILQGLVYLHGHNPPIIHRDLKSDNIFVNGSSGVIKIGDLGFATMQAGLSTVMSVIGTPEFMAPELYEEQYDEKVDVYSFGLCLLELAILEYPYAECRNAAQIFKKVSKGVPPEGLQKIHNQELREFIMLCITMDPLERPEARKLLKHPFFDSVRTSSVSGKRSTSPSGRISSPGISGRLSYSSMSTTAPSMLLASPITSPPGSTCFSSERSGNFSEANFQSPVTSTGGYTPMKMSTITGMGSRRESAGGSVGDVGAAIQRSVSNAGSALVKVTTAQMPMGDNQQLYTTVTATIRNVVEPSKPGQPMLVATSSGVVPAYEAAESNTAAQTYAEDPSAFTKQLSFLVQQLTPDTSFFNSDTEQDMSYTSGSLASPFYASSMPGQSGPEAEAEQNGGVMMLGPSLSMQRVGRGRMEETGGIQVPCTKMGDKGSMVRLACQQDGAHQGMLNFSMSINNKGNRKKVGFLYDLDEDEPNLIANEMVENLSLNVQEADFIANMIQQEIARLNMGGLSAAGMNGKAAPQGQHTSASVSRETSLPNPKLVLEGIDEDGEENDPGCFF